MLPRSTRPRTAEWQSGSVAAGGDFLRRRAQHCSNPRSGWAALSHDRKAGQLLSQRLERPGMEAADLFPDKWMKGIALSVYQNSSDTNSNWTTFIKRRGYLGQKQSIRAFQKANDFWNMYESDIQLVKEMGANSFRFSFEWAKFEPLGPGAFDQEAVDKFHKILDVCARLGVEPMVTLHHFTHPQWFEDKGGFTKAENEEYFVSYSTRVFQEYGHRVRLWTTFNEPTCFAFVGYIAGLWCPGELFGMQKCGQVLLNLLRAHVSVYRAIKALPGGQVARVGLVHQHIAFVPRDNWPWVRALGKWMTFWFGSHSVLTFFKTGTFEWDTPFSSSGPKALYTDARIAAGEPVNDWWGINYYSRPAIHWNLAMGAGADKERVSDTNFRIYPQGLYDSIKDASALGLPMFITEHGLADERDQHRAFTIRANHAALLQALADGYDVRGAYWWTLMDNIEWHEGFHIKFGLYRWDPEMAAEHAGSNGRPQQGLQLREGAKPLKQINETWPDDLTALRHYAQQHAASARPEGMKPVLDSSPLQVPRTGPPVRRLLGEGRPTGAPGYGGQGFKLSPPRSNGKEAAAEAIVIMPLGSAGSGGESEHASLVRK
ncbi:glycoside hydrolase superfamily [Haematococcus lacustris]